MRKIDLSIIIPCFNEESNLKRGVLKEVDSFLKKQTFTWEVIISDDGSTDKSQELVNKYIKGKNHFTLLENPHGGKPSALLFGLRRAKGNDVLLTDMDQSTPISELKKLMSYSKRFKAVIGSRGIVRKNFPLYRKLGAIVFAAVRRSLILPEIKDTQCGFKLFNRKTILATFPKLEYFKSTKDRAGWSVSSYDVELLYLLKKKGIKIKEVRVEWNDRDISKGKGSPLKKYVRESKEMFTQILRIKLNDLKGFY